MTEQMMGKIIIKDQEYNLASAPLCYNSIFDADVFFEFKNGQFIESRTVENFDRVVELRKKEDERDREKKKDIEAQRNFITPKESFLTKIMNLLQWKK